MLRRSFVNSKTVGISARTTTTTAAAAAASATTCTTASVASLISSCSSSSSHSFQQHQQKQQQWKNINKNYQRRSAQLISAVLASSLSTSASACAVAHIVNSTRAQSSSSASSSSSSSNNLETLLSGANAQWLDDMFTQWSENPSSVEPQFAAFFKQVQSMEPITMTATTTSSVAASSSSSSSSAATAAAAGGGAGEEDTRIGLLALEKDSSLGVVEAAVCKSKKWLTAFQNFTTAEAQKVLSMVLEFENSGHTVANLDPLRFSGEEIEPGIKPIGDSHRTSRHPLSKRKVALTPEHLGLSEADLNMTVPIGFCDNLGGVFRSTTPNMTLRELHAKMSSYYTGNIGWEFMHIDNFAVTQWLRNRIENPNPESVDRKQILVDLADGVAFEDFLHKKYGATKRFGLDGGESLVAGLRSLVHRSVDRHGAKKFVLGMAHRGRLNVLANVCGKPVRAIIKEFESITRDDLPDDGRQGDVKYHLGWLAEDLKSREKGFMYRMQLMFNPSHLEAVNPIAQGFTRCLQDITSGTQSSVIPITVHGDAAAAGQGIVYEDMCVSELPMYTTGGTIHVVINNQVGYTTNPGDSRSAIHSSDIARCFECPVFHVNGDCPEDVVRVFNLAADFRAQFNRSVCIDYVCYRRRGHNEGDDPTMTQPAMYRTIQKKPNVFEIYKNYLLDVQKGSVVSEEEAFDIYDKRMEILKQEKEEASKFDYKNFLMRPPLNWENHLPPTALDAQQAATTAISQEVYDTVASHLTRIPSDFKMNSKIAQIYHQREEDLKTGVVDYATAEALAIGSLLREGYSFRISGQDVQRGTFSHRHAVVHDANREGVSITPLREYGKSVADPNVPKHTQPVFSVTNSPLSEYGVMGYDAGYSLVSPKKITMWEAQFGDFYNGAQIIVDQFLVSGFTKWGLQYNTIISLPHGYDGQGPEHSSARMERFLQLVAEDENTPDFPTEAAQHWSNNIDIIVPSTSQSYFHLLRRFAQRNFRRPTFIFFSKSRLKERTSSKDDFLSDHAKFLPVIPDSLAETQNAAKDVKLVVLCQGQLYFDIAQEVKDRKMTKSVAVIRIEQLAPFPKKALCEEISRYSAGADIVWAQAEPENMGAWQYLQPRFEHALEGRDVRVVCRDYSASTATGSGTIHKLEQNLIMKHIFEGMQ